ncbi:MAG: sigma-70 family RNA polymerase sigma factor [Henriciella sp.]
MSLNNQSDTVDERAHLADCIQRVADERCKQSFAALFEHFAPRLKTFLIRQGTDEAGAEEIVQDVMLNVWRKAEQYDPRQASASTWIFRIARNRRIDRHRKIRPDLDPSDQMLQPQPAEQPDITVNRQQIELVVRREISTLPDDQLNLLKAAFYDGLSHAAISELFDLPLGTVKSRIRLAFQKLRRQLSEER